MFYPVKAFGEAYEMLAVVDSLIGSNRDVSVSDPGGQNWTLITNALPVTSGYAFVLRTNDYWITMSQSSSPPTIFQISYDNGETWTPSDSQVGATYSKVGYKPSSGLLVTTERGNTAKFATSLNGITWDQKAGTIDGPSDTTRIIYSPEVDIFVFLSGVNINEALNTRAFTSDDDGETWDISLAFGEYAAIADLTWAPALGKFVAVSTARTPTLTYKRASWTSTNGTTWTKHSNVLPDLLDLRSIAWSEALGLFVAVAYGYNNTITDKYITSPDGVTWTQRTLPEEGRFIAVIWNGAVFCAIESGFNTVNNAFISSDGINWTAHDMGAQLEWAAVASRAAT